MALFSKPLALDCSCYELGHCWTPSCVKASTDIAQSVFRESLKIYGSLYLITSIMRKKGKSYAWKKYIKKYFRETMQSTIFLTINGSMLITMFCVWRRLCGNYYYFNTFICGIPTSALSLVVERKDRKILRSFYHVSPFLICGSASLMAIIAERKSRRGLLAIYVTNLALETAYRMARNRGVVKPIPCGNVWLFSIASAVYFYYFRTKSGLPPSTVSGLSWLVGSAELPEYSQTSDKISNNNVYLERSIPKTGVASLDKMVDKLSARLKATPRHPACPHRYGCFLYVLRGFYRLFGLGYTIQAGFRLFACVSKLRKQPSLLVSALVHKDNLQLGAFLGSFSAVFRLVNCVLRWTRGKDDSSLHGMISGFIAAWSMLFYRSTTIALYVTTKMVEMLYFKGIEGGYLPYIKMADMVIYSLSTAFILHAAIMEPHALRPAYWKFLQRITDNKFGRMNRRLLDIFGTKASSLYPDYWPDYDPRYSNIKPPTS